MVIRFHSHLLNCWVLNVKRKCWYTHKYEVSETKLHCAKHAQDDSHNVQEVGQDGGPLVAEKVKDLPLKSCHLEDMTKRSRVSLKKISDNSPHRHQAEHLSGHLVSTAAVNKFSRLLKLIWLCVFQTLASVKSMLNWHWSRRVCNLTGTSVVRFTQCTRWLQANDRQAQRAYNHTDTC